MSQPHLVTWRLWANVDIDLEASIVSTGIERRVVGLVELNPE